MALSGVFYGTTSNPRIKPQISWEAVQSVAGNYSDVTARLQYTRSNSGYTTGGTWKGSLTINGDTASKSLHVEITNGNLTTAITHTVRVYHDAAGKKSITISASGGITSPADSTLKTTAISAIVTLDTIPRASEISATDCNIGAVSTVVISQKNSDFTHTLAYQFGALSGYLSAAGQPVEKAEKFSQTVVNFTVPESFYAQIPDSPTGQCRLTCVSYSGSAEIGTKTAAFTVTASKDKCLPDISLTAEDTWEKTCQLTGDPQVLVLNASRVQCTLAATAKNGASIVSRTLLSEQVPEQTLLDPVTTAAIAYAATDSRGYCAEQTYQAPHIPYITPTINLSVKRDAPTANTATLTVTGQCFAGSFGAAENTFSLDVYVDGALEDSRGVTLREDNSYSITIGLSYTPYQQSSAVRVVGRDAIFEMEKTATLPAGVPVFDWGAGDFRFNVPVYMPKLYVDEKEVQA